MYSKDSYSQSRVIFSSCHQVSFHQWIELWHTWFVVPILVFCISINTNSVKRYRKPICIMRIMSYSSVTAQVRHMLTRNQTVLPATHTFIHKLNKPYLPLTPSRRELPQWLVLISCPTEGRRLSWPKLLGEILRWFVHPKAVAHRSICHAASWLSSHESSALTTRLPVHMYLINRGEFVMLVFFSLHCGWKTGT